MSTRIDEMGAAFAATCPECEQKFTVESPMKDEVLMCGDCGLNLRVVSVDSVAKRALLELTHTDADDWGE